YPIGEELTAGSGGVGRGPSRIRTGDGGFAIRCLTAWRRGRPCDGVSILSVAPGGVNRVRRPAPRRKRPCAREVAPGVTAAAVVSKGEQVPAGGGSAASGFTTSLPPREEAMSAAVADSRRLSLAAETAADLMSLNPVSIRADATLREAVLLLH